MRPDFSTELTDLYCCRYDADSSKVMRRDAERAAVMKLVRGLFGEYAVYTHDAQGAPMIEGCAQAISVTHGAGMAVVAVSRACAVGVDVECWREQLVRVKAKYVGDDDVCCSSAYTLDRQGGCLQGGPCSRACTAGYPCVWRYGYGLWLWLSSDAFRRVSCAYNRG